MSDNQIEEWLLNRLGKGNVFEEFNRQFCRDFAKRQAEISFKAGKEWILEEAEMLCPHGTLAADTSKAYKRECDFCWHILKEGKRWKLKIQ